MAKEIDGSEISKQQVDIQAQTPPADTKDALAGSVPVPIPIPVPVPVSVPGASPDSVGLPGWIGCSTVGQSMGQSQYQDSAGANEQADAELDDDAENAENANQPVETIKNDPAEAAVDVEVEADQANNADPNAKVDAEAEAEAVAEIDADVDADADADGDVDMAEVEKVAEQPKRRDKYLLHDAIQEGALLEDITKILGEHDPTTCKDDTLNCVVLEAYSREGKLPIHKALLLGRNDIVSLFLSYAPSLVHIPYADIPITHLALSLASTPSPITSRL
jgi:hypothetical protein